MCLSRWHFAGRVIESLTFCWACAWVVDILLGVCLSRWHFAGRVVESLAFCWACAWVVGILLGVCLGRWHLAWRMFGSLTFSVRKIQILIFDFFVQEIYK